MSKALKYISLLFVVVLAFCLVPAVPVLAAPGVLNLDPNSGVYGDSVTIEGEDFTAGEDITIYFDDEEILSFSLSSTKTTFSRQYRIPSTSGGTHTFYAHGDISGDTDEETFTVEPKIELTGNAQGQAGESITVTGYGFWASETNIYITFDGVRYGAPKKADSDGKWTNTISIPALSGGDHEIGAYGTSTESSEVAELTFKVILNSLITLNKTSGTVGTALTITGSGFAASESGVRVTFDGNVVGTPSVSSSGTWTMTFNVPPLPGRTYVVDASGSTTAASSIPDLTFKVDPQFTISPVSGAAGALVSASGSGFGANENIPLNFDGTPVGANVNADSNGSWSATFTIPASSSGAHKIGAGSVVSPQTFTISSSISINKTSGVAGTSITVTGTSFAANETGITVTLDGTPVGSTVQAGSTGAWTATVTIPPTAGGDHSIGARGKTTPATAITEQTFTVLPVLSSLSKTSGPAGTSVTVTGTSFAAEENITITYDGIPVDAPTRTDDKGAWSATFKIPPSAAGNHTFKVSGSSSGPVNQGNLIFKITTGVSIEPDRGTVGSQVTVSGSGFTAGSPLKITYDDKPIANLAAVAVNDTGEINFSFQIPKSTAGLHVVKVMDNQNITEKIEFQIDSTPPSMPKPVSPADGLTMGFTGNINPTLSWSKSTGTSDITYVLQVGKDAEFADPLIEKADLDATKYTLSRSETLPNGSYYWRIKAVDAAGNESDWSRPYEIKSGVISSALLIILIILVIAIIALALYFFVIRPLRRRRAERELEGMAPPEVIIPEVVNAEYRALDTDEATKRRVMPWRLALPQSSGAPAVKGPKTLSSEDQARLKVIVEFAKSLPLVEPGYNTNWLVEMAENSTGSAASPVLYGQMLRGEIQIQYEPAWMRHPTFSDLQTLLEGQPIIQDLNSFIESVNHAAVDGMSLLQDIYKEITAEVSWDILADGGWAYVSAIYVDSLTWYQGKNLREPSDKDYTIKSEQVPGEGTTMSGLYAEQSTDYAGLLVKALDEKDASTLRVLHIKLRRNFRNSEKAGDICHVLTQLEVQRGRLLNAFSQFTKLNP